MGIMSMRECFTLLASKGFKIDEWKNQRGETPLHCAAEEGKMEMAKVLLELKADVNIKRKDLHSALSIAAFKDHAGMVSLLLEHGVKTHPGVYALHMGCIRGNAEVVRTLVEAGTDVREAYNGQSPARFCVTRPTGGLGSECKSGKAEALAIILEAGGDLNELFGGNSILHEAAARNLVECISLLVAKGLDPNLVHAGVINRNAPLHAACNEGSTEAVRELIKLGAELEKVDSNDRSPLCRAVVRGHAECTKVMIELGASVAFKDAAGFTPLHIAAARGDVKCAYLLVEAGAPLDALSVNGYSPLMVCMKPDLVLVGEMAGSKEGRTRVAKLLMEMEADMDDKVMQYAAEGGMNGVLIDSIKQFRRVSKSEKAYFSCIACTLMEHNEEVVYVRLVHRLSGEQAKDAYKLNTRLLERLSERQGGASAASPGQQPLLLPAAGNVLSTLLDPAKRGFKEKESGEAFEGKGKEVKLEYDGSDFTPQGFAVVVEYLTVGHVDNSLIDKGWRQTLQEGGEEGGGGDGDNDGVGGGAVRKRKQVSGSCGSGARSSSEEGVRKKTCLFDDAAAGKALEAARYFCLEGMEEEVKRLMDLYGFAYDDSP